MSFNDQLLQAARRNDLQRVRDLLVAVSENERRAAAEPVERLMLSRPAESEAVALAFLGTATGRKVASWSWVFGESSDEDAEFDVIAARGRGFLQTLARAMAERDGIALWPLVRRAVRGGLIERPDDDSYTRGMVACIADGPRGIEAAHRGLLADEELLDDDVWRIFEVDCGSELSWMTTWEQGRRGDNLWAYALKRLADEGRVDRTRLLDASLDALARDFRAKTITWYVRFHEELGPTHAERVKRIDRYLALVTSPAPPVVKAGLAALKALGDDVPWDELARVAVVPLAQRQKNLATEALALLARAAERSPEARPALLEAAAHGVAHERTDVQERALAIVERYADEPEATSRARAVLLGLGEAVAPTLRARIEALTGFTPEPEPARAEPVPHSEPRRDRLTLEDALRTRPPLEPVHSVEELIELAAALLEGQGDGDDAERFLDGVSRLCGERPPERLTAGLVKRANTDLRSVYGADTGATLVGLVVRAWAAGDTPRAAGYPGTALGFLGLRASEVAERARRRKPRLLLAFPTHSGGWLDPEVLAEREREFGRVRNRPDAADAALARLRAATLSPLRLEPQLERRKSWSSPDPAATLIVRLQGDSRQLGPLHDAACALGRGDDERFWWTAPPAWNAWDRLAALWCLTLVPSLPELSFAGAASACVSVADSGTAYLHPEVAFEHALDRDVPLAQVAWIAIAAALLGKVEDLRRPATDLLVQTVEDGRFDAPALGCYLAWLLDERVGKAPRLAGPLRDVGRVSRAHADRIVRTVEALLATLRQTPANLHAVLEVVVELAAGGTTVASPPARATLERVAGEVSRGSKLGKLAGSLLEG